MKAYTDLKQSKKLAEILPIESADMCWTNHLFNEFLSSLRIESTPPQEYKNLLDRFIVRGYLIEPAWSLSALLRFFDDRSGLAKQSGIWFAYNNNISYCTKHYTDEIDAVFEMILKLHELNLL